ncbi:MAG: ubiquinol-cytochrome c reductase iron-sulfur subunit [Deltaproteobacteria bacterium]|jgi:rieske iron-sulfur protein
MVDASSKSDYEKKQITRRRITIGILWAAVVGVFGSLLTMLKVVAPEKKGGGYVATVAPGDRLVYAKGSQEGNVLRASAFKDGDAVLAYPQGKTRNQANLVQLIRLKEEDFKPPTRMEMTDQGFVAYSAICTHLGCTVSWVKNQQDPDASYTECYCHNSIFNPARGAEVMGGPAPIPLAQIGIKVAADGALVFSSGFSGPVGPRV